MARRPRAPEGGLKVGAHLHSAMDEILALLSELGRSSRLSAILSLEWQCRHSIYCSARTCKFMHRMVPMLLKKAAVPTFEPNHKNMPSLESLCHSAVVRSCQQALAALPLPPGLEVPPSLRLCTAPSVAPSVAPRHVLFVLADAFLDCDATPQDIRAELGRDCQGLLDFDRLSNLLASEGVDVPGALRLHGQRSQRIDELQGHLDALGTDVLALSPPTQMALLSLEKTDVLHGLRAHTGERAEDAERAERALQLVALVLERGSDYWLLRRDIGDFVQLEMWKWSLRHYWQLNAIPQDLSPDEAWLLASTAVAWGPKSWGSKFEEAVTTHVYSLCERLRERLRGERLR